LFAGIHTGEVFYFVHSFAPRPADPGDTIATTSYGGSFTSAARSGSRVGVQFHPERSGPAGLRVLANFVTACSEAADAA
jgi:imidazoleglycerol phosphate synthase glutamine amidotransferase subunit HisH